MGDSDGLFDAADLEHVEPVEAGVEVGAGVNKRFRAFEPHAVMLVPPSFDEWLPQTHLSRFIADLEATWPPRVTECASIENHLTITHLGYHLGYRMAVHLHPHHHALMTNALTYQLGGRVSDARQFGRLEQEPNQQGLQFADLSVGEVAENDFLPLERDGLHQVVHLRASAR